MGRKKGSGAGGAAGQVELSAGVVAQAEAAGQKALAREGPPALVEFTSRVTGKMWRLEKFAELSAVVGGLDRAEVPRFHEMLECSGPQMARGYLIVRRVFGMRPVMPTPEMPMDDLRIWSMEELANSLACAAEVLQAEMLTVQGAWKAFQNRQVPQAQPDDAAAGSSKARSGAETGARLGDERAAMLRTLAEFRFDPRMFEISGRAQAQNDAELQWCVERIEELRSALQNKYAREPARMMILNELGMQREQQALMALDTNDTEKQSEINQRRRRLEEMQMVYQEQLSRVNELFPFMDRTASAGAWKCALSELVEGFRKYAADGRNDLIDGFQTAYEVQVQTRQSVQMPTPKYKPSLVLAVNEARAGLWDPNFKSQLEPKHLLRLDRAWASAYTAAATADGLELTDLESDDPVRGEYPPIYEGTRE